MKHLFIERLLTMSRALKQSPNVKRIAQPPITENGEDGSP
jgi:hypothetical protein